MKRITRRDAGSKQASQKLLVIGDWLLDEDWVTGEHRGAISSRTGSTHLRALHHHDNPLYRIAGAGQAASVLYCALKERPAPSYEIYGVGVWDQQDTAAMKALLDLDHEAEVRPSQYRITRHITGDSCTAELFNLGKIVDEKEKCKERKYRSGTMRAIRIYQHRDGRLELKERIDWEPRIFDDRTAWIGLGEQAVLNNSDLNKKPDKDKDSLAGLVTGATAIVAQDAGKGVMSSSFVKWLTKLAPDAEWFISTKAWRPARDPAVPEEEPDWLHELERAEAKVRLLFIPEAAAQRAVDEGDLSRWIVTVKDNGGPSSKALKRIDNLARQFPKAAIAVLPGGFALLARNPGTKPQCIVQSDTGIRDSSVVGAAISTVLFPAITAHMLQGKSADRETIEQALHFTRCCWRNETDRIKHSESKPTPVQRPQVFGGKGKEDRFGRWSTDSWGALDGEWEQALKGCGIIDEPPRIELWRAMIDIDGFVCCVPTKRHAIGRIRRELDLFKREPRPQRRAASFMVVAPPGSGKTHFVKRLAKSCDLSLVQFSITQLNKKDDILDCFDAIVTRHAQDDRPLLVFFDEINACLHGQHVYDSFLAAIEEGTYVRGGKTFRMPACAWLFAGTENPAEHPDKSTKGSDFVSRLSLPPIDVQLEAGEEADLNTEHVYLGVSLLKQAFSDVREVSNKVLQAFEYIRPDVDVRQIIHFVNSFSDIQHEKVLSRNIPLDLLKSLTHPHTSHRHHFDKWKELGEGVLVAIEGEGPVRKAVSLLNTQSDLGLSELKKTFPEVKQVSKKVLEAFEFMRPDVDVRQIRHFVNSFSDVQQKVLARNIPHEQLESLTHPDISHRHHFNKWNLLDEGKLVDIAREGPLDIAA